MALGAVALMVMAALFGEEARLWPIGDAPPELEKWADTNAALAPEAPRQALIEVEPRPLMAAGFVAAPSHSFVAEALVLSRKSYRHDAEAAISPLDLMLGWGPMSNPAVLDHIDLRQSRRFGFVGAAADAPVDLDALSPFWANVHIIPASAAVAAELEQIRAGQILRLEGALVNVVGPKGWRWLTSTTRTDRGGGACEIFLVTAIARLG